MPLFSLFLTCIVCMPFCPDFFRPQTVLVVPVLGNVSAGVLCSLLDVLFVGELVVIGTEDFHRADIAFETDLLESVGKSLMRQAVAGLIGPQALSVSVVLGAAGDILNTVQVPDEDPLAIGLLEGLERRSLAVEVILVKSDTNVGRTDFLDARASSKRLMVIVGWPMNSMESLIP